MTFGKRTGDPHGNGRLDGSASHVDTLTRPARRSGLSRVEGIKPRVMILVNDWGTGAHAVVADRLSLQLQRQGCEVTIFTNKRCVTTLGQFSRLSNDNPTIVAMPDTASVADQQKLFCELLDDAHSRPDVIITEHFPFCKTEAGPGATIKACVKTAKDQHPEIQIHGLVRDIPDIRNTKGTCEDVLGCFDKIFVRGDAGVYNLATQQHFPDDQWRAMKDKIHYVGYPVDVGQPNSAPVKADKKGGSVVVSLGAGDKADNVRTYQDIMNAIPEIERVHDLRSKTWHFYASSPKQYGELKDMRDYVRGTSKMADAIRAGYDTKIEIHPFTKDKDFGTALANADLVICRGGLTAIEATANLIPTLIIPRKGREGGEQEVRTTALADMRSTRVSVWREPKDEIPSDLSQPIKDAYAKRRVKAETPFATNGHELATQNIIEIFNHREPTQIGGRGVAG